MPGRITENEPATGTDPSLASRADRTAAASITATSSSRPMWLNSSGLVAYVLAISTSAPAARYSRCASRTISGWREVGVGAPRVGVHRRAERLDQRAGSAVENDHRGQATRSTASRSCGLQWPDARSTTSLHRRHSAARRGARSATGRGRAARRHRLRIGQSARRVDHARLGRRRRCQPAMDPGHRGHGPRRRPRRAGAWRRARRRSPGSRTASTIAVPEAWLLPVPDGVDLAQVAALPVAGITAWLCVARSRPASVHSTACWCSARAAVSARWPSNWPRSSVPRCGARPVRRPRSTASRPTAPTTWSSPEPRALEAAVESFEPTVVLDSLGGPFTDAAIAAIDEQGSPRGLRHVERRAGLDQPSAPLPQGRLAAGVLQA